MHIPDGFLAARVAAAAAAVAAVGVAAALGRARSTLPPRRVPLIGLAAAFVFAAQMLNFPVAAGTSGHLLGGVLAAVLLGPAAAVVVMTAVLILQCFMFADGGVTALGANVLNMALLAPLSGYLVYRAVRAVASPDPRGLLLAAGFAAWCSTVIAAGACALELALSGVVPARLALPAMVGVHMLIGLGEAAITMLVLAAVIRARPELLAASGTGRQRSMGWPVAVAVVTALVLAAPFASSLPDGLEHVAARFGFAGRAMPLFDAPLGYGGAGTWPLLAAAAAGTLAAFALAYGLARALTPARPRH